MQILQLVSRLYVRLHQRPKTTKISRTPEEIFGGSTFRDLRLRRGLIMGAEAGGEENTSRPRFTKQTTEHIPARRSNQGLAPPLTANPHRGSAKRQQADTRVYKKKSPQKGSLYKKTEKPKIYHLFCIILAGALVNMTIRPLQASSPPFIKSHKDGQKRVYQHSKT